MEEFLRDIRESLASLNVLHSYEILNKYKKNLEQTDYQNIRNILMTESDKLEQIKKEREE